jgi:hypothetical protein
LPAAVHRPRLRRDRPLKIYGVDFTSAPRLAKPITVVGGSIGNDSLLVGEVEALESFAQFEAFLQRPGPWIGGFDFPFGLSREAIIDLGWPGEWPALLAHCRNLGRAQFKRILDAYRETRPAGRRYATRRGDDASGAHPSVKFVNPPVAYMFLEGACRLAAAGLHIPGLQVADTSRVALEAYPGLLVRGQLGIRVSYKSDDPARHTPARKRMRERIIDELLGGRPLGIQLRISDKLRSAAVGDGSGDLLDAMICAVQAAWGWSRRNANFGLPDEIDPLEGWIVSARPLTS